MSENKHKPLTLDETVKLMGGEIYKAPVITIGADAHLHHMRSHVIDDRGMYNIQLPSLSPWTNWWLTWLRGVVFDWNWPLNGHSVTLTCFECGATITEVDNAFDVNGCRRLTVWGVANEFGWLTTGHQIRNWVVRYDAQGDGYEASDKVEHTCCDRERCQEASRRESSEMIAEADGIEATENELNRIERSAFYRE